MTDVVTTEHRRGKDWFMRSLFALFIITLLLVAGLFAWHGILDARIEEQLAALRAKG